MPIVEELVNDVGESSWFCLLDLCSAYWQVAMDEESIPKTAFSTRLGHYEFLRMAMGLKAAAGTFQRMINHAIHPVRDVCQAYLDDLLIHAKMFEGCLDALHRVLVVLLDCKLLVSFKKCKLRVREVAYLGFLLTKDGVKLDPSRIEAIAKLQAPHDVKTLQQVLCLFQYYTRFHPNYAAVAAPLTELTKKAVVWRWSEDCQRAFDTIKQVLTMEPFVARPDFSKPFLVQTDWSPVALGAILAQEVWDEELQLKREVVVYYASKKLRGPELNYSATDGKRQAVLWAVKIFRPYLYGQRFELHTNHLALKWLLTCRDLMGKLARWSLRLQAYNFKVFHKQGRLNQNVDALSRLEVLATACLVGLAAVQEDEEEAEANFEAERQAFLQQDRLRSHGKVQTCQQVRVVVARMAHLLEDMADWFLDDRSDEGAEWCLRAQEGLALTEDKLVDVFCLVAPELALHSILADNVVTEEDSEAEESEEFQAPRSSGDMYGTPLEKALCDDSGVGDDNSLEDPYAAWSPGGVYGTQLQMAEGCQHGLGKELFCVCCRTGNCGLCLCKEFGWLLVEIERAGWICGECDVQSLRFKGDIFEDIVTMKVLKVCGH